MKNKPHSQLPSRWLSAICALAVAGSAGVSLAQDFVISNFDTEDGVTNSISGWKLNGGRPTTLVWSPTVDSDNNPSSGSMYVTVNWNPTNGNNYQESQLSRGHEYDWPYISLAPYANFEFNIKVDVANSVLATNLEGTPVSYVEAEPIIQQWDWTPLGSTSIPNSNGWLHIVRPLGGATTMANPILSLHWGWLQIPAGDISYWIDNINSSPHPTSLQQSLSNHQLVASRFWLHKPAGRIRNIIAR